MVAVASTWFPAALKDTLTAATRPIDWDTDTQLVNLYTDNLNGPTTTNMATEAGTPTVSPWDTGSGGRVAASGTYAQDTTALTTPTITVTGLFPGTGRIVYSAGVIATPNNLSWTGTTFATSVRGIHIYSNTAAPKRGLVFINFGAGPYTTNNGTFGVNWDTTNGIAYISFA